MFRFFDMLLTWGSCLALLFWGTGMVFASPSAPIESPSGSREADEGADKDGPEAGPEDLDEGGSDDAESPSGGSERIPVPSESPEGAADSPPQDQKNDRESKPESKRWNENGPLVPPFAATESPEMPLGLSWKEVRASFWAQGLEARSKLKSYAQDDSTLDQERCWAFHLLAQHNLQALYPEGAFDAFQEAMRVCKVGAKQPLTKLEDELQYGLLVSSVMVLEKGGESKASEKQLKAWAQAIENNPHSDRRPEAAFYYARSLDLLGKRSLAKGLYKQVQQRFPDGVFIPELKRYLIEAPSLDELAKHRGRKASPPLASLQAVMLPNERLPLSQLEAYLKGRQFGPLREGLLPWLKEPAPEASPEEWGNYYHALMILMQEQIETYHYKEALETHETLIKKGQNGLSQHQEVEIKALSGAYLEAKTALGKSYRKNSKAYWTALGDLAYRFMQYEDAYEAWSKAMGEKKAESAPTEPMLFALLRMNKTKAPINAWKKHQDERGTRHLKERYWLARALAYHDQMPDAVTLYKHIVEDAAFSYYGVQAASRLMEIEDRVPKRPEILFSSHSSVLKKDSDPDFSASTVFWTNDSYRGNFSEALRPSPNAVILEKAKAFNAKWGEIFGEAGRALEWAELGDYKKAISELRVIDMDLRASIVQKASLLHRTRSELLDFRRKKTARAGESLKSRRSRYSKASEKRIKEEFRDIRRDMRDVQRALGDPYAERRYVFENERTYPLLPIDQSGTSLFPLAYPDIVEPISRQLNLPVYFLYAVMTVESSYHPGAVSVADAHGLVQVIPSTGNHLARELGYLQFMPEDLLTPSRAIYFGAYYLARLLSRFSGQEPLAAAAYNAGPHRVSKWLIERGHLPLDMFIEDIPFRQARRYTKRMFEYIYTYRYIYHQEKEVYFKNTINLSLGEGPNY